MFLTSKVPLTVFSPTPFAASLATLQTTLLSLFRYGFNLSYTTFEYSPFSSLPNCPSPQSVMRIPISLAVFPTSPMGVLVLAATL